jgi:hypothetical protein
MYVRKIQEAAGDQVEWVFFDPDGAPTVLAVSGCDRQCVETARFERDGCRVISIKDDRDQPSSVLSALLGEGKES